MDTTKPPIGVCPAYIASADRIQKLAEAIGRYSGDVKANAEYIKIWAEEIIMQCDVACIE